MISLITKTVLCFSNFNLPQNGNPVESKEIIKELDRQDKELGIKNENKKEQE